MTDQCPDCAVPTGAPHAAGCDVARCLVTGLQRLSCRHLAHDCGEDVWSGRWPGEAECEEFDWWAYFVPYGNPSWRPCGPDHAAARHDLNRLVREALWDRDAMRWRRA